MTQQRQRGEVEIQNYLMKVRYDLEESDDNSDKNEALTQGCETFLQNPNCNNCINLWPNKENLTSEKNVCTFFGVICLFYITSIIILLRTKQ